MVRGILQPVLKYRYRIIFPTISQTNNDVGIMLMQQVMNCKIDMINQKFYLEIRQPVAQNIFKALKQLSKYHNEIWVEPMSSTNDAAHFTIVLADCKMTEHNFELDYGGGSNVATHKMVFDYRDLIEADSKENQDVEDDVGPGLTPEEAIEKSCNL